MSNLFSQDSNLSSKVESLCKNAQVRKNGAKRGDNFKADSIQRLGHIESQGKIILPNQKIKFKSQLHFWVTKKLSHGSRGAITIDP